MITILALSPTFTGQNQETEPTYCTCTDFITDHQSTRTDDLNIAISDASSTLEPKCTMIKRLTRTKLDMFRFKKLFKHYNAFPDCQLVQAQRKPRPDSDNMDLPAYFVKFAGEPCYSVLKGPHSRYHCEKWWNFMDRAAPASTPEDLPYLLGKIRKIYKFAEDGAVVRNAPTQLQHPP